MLFFRNFSYFSKNSQKTSFFGHFWRFWVTENIFFKNFFPSYCELFRKTFAIYRYNRYLCMLEKYDLTTNMQGQGNIVGEVPKTLDFWGGGGGGPSPTTAKLTEQISKFHPWACWACKSKKSIFFFCRYSFSILRYF